MAVPEHQLERARALALALTETNSIGPAEREPEAGCRLEIDILVLRLGGARLEERPGAERELVRDDVPIAAEAEADDILVAAALVAVRRDLAALNAGHRQEASAGGIARKPNLDHVGGGVVRPRHVELDVEEVGRE